MMQPPLLCLCMAGEYARFRNAGYTTPKFLLSYCGSSILRHVAECFPGIDTVCIAHEKDRKWEFAIRNELPPHVKLVWTSATRGQADTAFQGICECEESEERPVLIHNVDTIVRNRSIATITRTMEHASGYIDIFRSAATSLSYVHLDESGAISEITEKQRVSGLATSGLYGFRTIRTFTDAFNMTVSEHRGREMYISSLYAHMLQRGDTVLPSPPYSAVDTIVLGTPEQYEQHSTLF